MESSNPKSSSSAAGGCDLFCFAPTPKKITNTVGGVGAHKRENKANVHFALHSFIHFVWCGGGVLDDEMALLLPSSSIGFVLDS